MQVEREHLNEQLLGEKTELEQIVYVTSHDLRSPLVNIQGFSKELELTCRNVLSYLQEIALPESIRIQVNALLKEEIPESVNFILTSASKMDLLLKGLLRISRLGRTALGPELLDMNALMSDIAADSEFKRKEKGISLRVGDSPACYADRGQVLQVFSNLLENAIKYLDSDRPGMIYIEEIPAL